MSADRRFGAAFDAAAAGYDEDFSGRSLARILRGKVWEQLDRSFAPGDRVLDLGCGSGEDIQHLALRGVRCIGIDTSGEMLRVAKLKLDSISKAARPAFVNGDLGQLPIRSGPFDGAYSNFGALNCLPSVIGLGERLGTLVKPGGPLVVVVMPPFCLWETVWHLLSMRPAAAFRRLRAGAEANVDGGSSVRVWYPSPSTLQRQLGERFELVRLAGLGSFLPPSYLSVLFERSRLFQRAAGALESLVSPFSFAASLSDHYLAVFRCREE